MSSPRLRRLKSDYAKVMEEFSGHPYITVKPEAGEYPEKYDVTYRVPGLHLVDNTPVENGEHKVVFYLEKNYPQFKPKCEIKTPIFHPNFRGGVVCIGDYWSAGGENLVDLIVKVGDMIQYKEYNIQSPMDATAANWVTENEDCLPVSNIDLYREDITAQLETAATSDDDWSIEINEVAEADPSDADLDFELEFMN